MRGLQQMLERDLADWARAREEHSKSPWRGPLTSDVTHSYTLQYQRAFSAIGGAEVIVLMKDYLPDLRFGVAAACVLMDIWKQDHPYDKDGRFAAWHGFSNVRVRRAQRLDPQHPPETSDFAEAIFTVVRALGTHGNDDANQRHAIALARVGLGIPHGTKRDEINTLLDLPEPYAVKQQLLTAAAMAGEVIPADVLLAGTQELLELAKKDAWPWRLDEKRGELMGWIELFAFSDRPLVVLNAIDLLSAEHRHPWCLRRLLSALGNSPHQDTLQVLNELGRRDPRFLEERNWLNAMMELGTAASAQALLDLVCDGKLSTTRRGFDVWRFSRHIAGIARKLPSIRDDMLQRYERMPNAQPKAILESALAELADAEVIPVLIRSYAADKKPFDGSLYKAVRDIAVGERPIAKWSGAFEQFSVPLAALRKQLFGLFAANDSQSALAEACLITIDELRDEHGRIDEEPRHPDIESERPWPKEVNESVAKAV